ncbi:MAG: hypothetical protein P1T08_12890 [Acidimicrobiia bacterium]|nr:hypothetical protein [Acidimicrobiia bacterium]
MNEPFGAITSLVNGHVDRMLKRLDSLIEVTKIYVETSGEVLTRSLYLGPTDERDIPVGTYFLLRVETDE